MSKSIWQELLSQLEGREYQFGVITPDAPLNRIQIEPGLTDAEVVDAESRFGFRFPPDLREFLQTGLPIGRQFPDWRSGETQELHDWLDLPRQGVLFDVENNDFWLEEWGEQPSSLDDARRIVNELIDAAPRLIPVYGHRMIPDEPHLPGNPVFSVHQTDIIIYGTNLANYFRVGFKLLGPRPQSEAVRSIRFWDIERFQEVRWGDGYGPLQFDNSKGWLP